MAHKKHKKKFLNIILIPDDESSPRNFKIRFSVLTAALLIFIFIFVGLVIGAVTYGKLLQKAYENISLRQQNEQLAQQLQKINELSEELDDLKTYGRKVQNSLVGYVNLQGDLEEVSTLTKEDNLSNPSLAIGSDDYLVFVTGESSENGIVNSIISTIYYTIM